MEKYDAIIIGAGASGLMCALHTSVKTLLLEANERVGKKILATGNGKCNLSHDNLDVRAYNTPLVAPYLVRFNQVQTLNYFEKLGVFTYADQDGRRYPLSNSANTVLDLMLKALSQKSNVTVAVNTAPTAVYRVADGFSVKTQTKAYFCRQLVIATGGNSGTRYFDNLRIPYQHFQPSLMGLKTTKNKGLAGVRVSNVRVKYHDFDEVGEILFKEDGISGIVIFNLSAYLVRHKIQSGQMTIDLLAGVEQNHLLAMLRASISDHPNYLLADILEGIVHKSLAKYIVDKLTWGRKKASEIQESEISLLVQALKQCVITFTGYADHCQVHHGGIDLQDLDATLQHKKIPHLYFVGEVVNVDGMCGGYNLQWAWTSGKIVGDSLT